MSVVDSKTANEPKNGTDAPANTNSEVKDVKFVRGNDLDGTDPEKKPTGDKNTEEEKPNKHKLDEEESKDSKTETSVKKHKKKHKRSRRNYDDIPPPADDEEDEEEDLDDEKLDALDAEDDEEEEDNLLEIDTSNIIQGRRTRGKKIDYTKTSEKLMKESGSAVDDEEDDEDFQPEEKKTK